MPEASQRKVAVLDVNCNLPELVAKATRFVLESEVAATVLVIDNGSGQKHLQSSIYASPREI
jgi:hypothetical protein